MVAVATKKKDKLKKKVTSQDKDVQQLLKNMEDKKSAGECAFC